MADYAVDGLTARATGTMFKGATPPAPIVRRQKKVDHGKQLRAAYAEVDKRDGKRCRLTGKPLRAGHVDEWQRLERDHLAPRSTAPERFADVDNLLTAAAAVHVLLQSGALVPVDSKGEPTTYVSRIAGYVWNRTMVKKAPFRLGAKEWKDRNAKA